MGLPYEPPVYTIEPEPLDETTAQQLAAADQRAFAAALSAIATKPK